MNRLILVGNGFDLAHGLKTSYKDFIIGHLTNCFLRTDPYQFYYEDELLLVKIAHPIDFLKFVRSKIEFPCKGLLIEKKEIESFFELCYEHGVLWDLFNFDSEAIANKYKGDARLRFFQDISNVLAIQINCSFYKKIISTCIDCNWVDIENEYFDALKKCKNEDGLFNFTKVKKLNNELQFLKEKLEKYLKEQIVQDISMNHHLSKLMHADFEFKDFKAIEGYESESKYRRDLGYTVTNKKTFQHKLYFLNFNYTQTVNLYKDSVQSSFKCYGINHIHGELDSESNPIIFGFGDEHDREYLTFEEQGRNELFEHIKSYQYFKTNNYRNLVSFLNSDKYQVYIMGHSCGLSDRTMFKEIFDHENCKSVKIFHYAKSKDENDFWEKTVNLGRHFSDKGRMRKLIVDYKASDAFPQSTVIDEI